MPRAAKITAIRATIAPESVAVGAGSEIGADGALTGAATGAEVP